ncbi:MAG: hypothetical protein WA081_06875 [Desulfosalsimonadaceae bacterium]
MERCPTCQASYKGKPVCHRCGTEIGLLIRIEDDAAAYLEKAETAFAVGDYEKAFGCARRSFSLRQSQAARKLLADSAMLTGRFRIGIQYKFRHITFQDELYA